MRLSKPFRALRRQNRELRGKLAIAERVVALLRKEILGGGRPADDFDSAPSRAEAEESAGKSRRSTASESQLAGDDPLKRR